MEKDFDMPGILVYQRTEDGKISFCASSGDVPTTTNKFSYGCILIDISTGKLYRNGGSYASPSWEETSKVTTNDEISNSYLQVATKSLTSANLKAMRTTAPIEIVPAVTGKTIVVDDVTFTMTRTATAYTGGGAVEFRYTDGSGAKVTADIASTVVTGAEGVVYNINKSVNTSLAGVVSSPIVITNATAAFADGTGTAEVKVRYHLI